MTRSSTDGTSTLTRVLANAARLFREKGYAGTSTRELAASAGLQSASLYHHIGTKEDLLHRLSVQTVEEVGALFEEIVAEHDDPVATVERLVRGYVDVLLTQRDRYAVTLTEVRALSEDRRAEVVALRDRTVAVVRAAVVRAQRAGGLRSDIDPKYATLALFNLLNWTIFWYDPDEALDPDGVANLLWGVLFRGLREDPAAPTKRPGRRSRTASRR